MDFVHASWLDFPPDSSRCICIFCLISRCVADGCSRSYTYFSVKAHCGLDGYLGQIHNGILVLEFCSYRNLVEIERFCGLCEMTSQGSEKRKGEGISLLCACKGDISVVTSRDCSLVI